MYVSSPGVLVETIVPLAMRMSTLPIEKKKKQYMYLCNLISDYPTAHLKKKLISD